MHLRSIQLFIVVCLMAILSGCVLPVATSVHAYGRVLDSANKRPISDARVSIEGVPNATVLTTKDGTFDIPRQSKWTIILPIPIDRFPMETIIINAPGYETQRSEVAQYEHHPILLKRK